MLVENMEPDIFLLRVGLPFDAQLVPLVVPDQTSYAACYFGFFACYLVVLALVPLVVPDQKSARKITGKTSVVPLVVPAGLVEG